MTIEETIWNEGRHEKLHANVAGTYPEGIHGAITAGLQNEGFTIRCVSPIAEGLPPFFEVPQSEMYGEPFDIPVPDELIFCLGSKEVKYFAAAARSHVADVAFSFLDPAMKRFRSANYLRPKSQPPLRLLMT